MPALMVSAARSRSFLQPPGGLSWSESAGGDVDGGSPRRLGSVPVVLTHSLQL